MSLAYIPLEQFSQQANKLLRYRWELVDLFSNTSLYNDRLNEKTHNL